MIKIYKWDYQNDNMQLIISIPNKFQKEKNLTDKCKFRNKVILYLNK